MRFFSTRGEPAGLSLSEAILRGLAPDGGLYVPDAWPSLTPADFDQCETLADVGARLIAPFAKGDRLESLIAEITADAFNFPAPLVPVTGSANHSEMHVLELFHGPTAAFKDFGARFLAASFQRLRSASDPTVNILVATSGDTGGAVAAAFHRRPGMAVTVLFPKGLVSPTQERQLTCWGDNVRSFAVAGTFDDCQRMVKEAFVDEQLNAAMSLSSANSINLGRLLPQAAYYASTSLQYWRTHARKLIIPSGNLGNAVACIWARHLGLPIGRIVLAHNANRTVVDYLQSGEWAPRRSLATLASAMDVGHPSNMERLRALYPDVDRLREAVTAESVDDTRIAARIRSDRQRFGQIWCPHTAVAAEVWAGMDEATRRDLPWCLVATASPAKFPEIVEPLIDSTVPVPPALAELLQRPTQVEPLEPSLAALRSALLSSHR
jgi:threonine synthase